MISNLTLIKQDTPSVFFSQKKITKNPALLLKHTVYAIFNSPISIRALQDRPGRSLSWERILGLFFGPVRVGA